MEDWEESCMQKYGIRVKVKRSLRLILGPEEVSYLILKAAKESEQTSRSCPTGLAAAACYIAAVLSSNKYDWPI